MILACAGVILRTPAKGRAMGGERDILPMAVLSALAAGLRNRGAGGTALPAGRAVPAAFAPAAGAGGKKAGCAARIAAGRGQKRGREGVLPACGQKPEPAAVFAAQIGCPERSREGVLPACGQKPEPQPHLRSKKAAPRRKNNQTSSTPTSSPPKAAFDRGMNCALFGVHSSDWGAGGLSASRT